MAEFRFTKGTFEGLKKKIGGPEPLLKAIGVFLVGESQRAFRAQKFKGKEWLPRKTPNVAGIVRDLMTNSSVKPRRFEPRPALIDTGRLRGSIAYRVSGNKVEVGTKLSYASLHQTGGESESLPGAGKGGNKTLRRNLKDFLARTDDDTLREKLGWLFGVDSFKINVPARPFLGITQEARKRIQVMILSFLGGK